jgi:hypothetical protein
MHKDMYITALKSAIKNEGGGGGRASVNKQLFVWQCYLDNNIILYCIKV